MKTMSNRQHAEAHGGATVGEDEEDPLDAFMATTIVSA